MGASLVRKLPAGWPPPPPSRASSVSTAQAQQTIPLPVIDVATSTRLGAGIAAGFGIAGSSTTVITAQEIERSPGQTLAGHAVARARHPGAQPVRHRSTVRRRTVDMRGFGAAGTSNTLVLVNGRRLNDIDMAGVDFSAIPKNSIERIEITRGNCGAVLYGDGAVGGVINIVTKNGRRAAAVGARAGGLRLVQLPRRQRRRRTRRAGRCGLASMPTRSAPTAIARTTSCARRMRSAISAGPTDARQRLSQPLRRQPASRPSGRPAGDRRGPRASS